MASIKIEQKWNDGIYQLETTDPVIGGEDGIDNLQAKQLGGNIFYLREKGIAEWLAVFKYSKHSLVMLSGELYLSLVDNNVDVTPGSNEAKWTKLIKPSSTTIAGIVKLNNTISSTSVTEAATANAVKLAMDKANSAYTAGTTSASTSVVGVVKLNNTTNSTSTTEAATANAVKVAMDKATSAATAAGAAQTAASTAQTTANNASTAASEAKTTAGSAQTTANAAKTTAETAASTTVAGRVKLNNTTNSTSVEEAATANAVKVTMDKATSAATAAGAAQTTANNANTAAGAAQTAANNAQTTANTAKTTAETVASTTVAGRVKLNNATNSTSTTEAATANAVKVAMDKATSAATAANNAVTNANGRVPNTRKINNKALSADITLSADDTGSLPATKSGTTYEVGTQTNFAKVPTFVNKPPIYVIESYVSADGTSWYRKYSDGWIEQGGVALKPNSVINLPLNFINSNYSLVFGSSGGNGTPRYSSKTTSSFVYSPANVNDSFADWIAKGF